MDCRTATNEDILAAWDAGDSIWSCEMGGMGPGYEQCIQIMGFEMLRAMLANRPNWEKMEGPAWRDYVDKIDADPKVKLTVKTIGLSGAQHGAAMHIAAIFAKNGYAKGMAMVPENRRIQVRRAFPTLETVSTD